MSQVTSELLEQSRKREAAKPGLARQEKLQRSKKADGGVHTVNRVIHTSRVQDAATSHEVARPEPRRWQRASSLPAIPAPAGYHVEWVRRDDRHRNDHANMLKHVQEGWELCRKSDFPKHVLPTQRFDGHGEVIGNDSSVLMKIPEELLAQRNAYYNQRRDRATRAVDDQEDVGLNKAMHKKMPLVENRNETDSSLERGRSMGKRRIGGGRAHVAED